MSRGEGMSLYRGVRITAVEARPDHLLVSVGVKQRRAGWDEYDLVMPRIHVHATGGGLVDVLQAVVAAVTEHLAADQTQD